MQPRVFLRPPRQHPRHRRMADMKCVCCGLGMKEGVALFRQNEKGVPAIWKCARHALDVPKDLLELVSVIQGGPK